MKRRGSLTLLCCLFAGVAKTAADEDIDFNRDIRPILAENCYRCHGPDPQVRQGDLRLDLRASALESEAIIPGDPDSSWLIDRIESDDPDWRMPPPESRQQLSDRERQLLRQWIAEGAEYQNHWAYIPPKLFALPDSARENVAPIDAWIETELQAQNLVASPPADPETLLRRVYLDLVGLPPNEAQQAEFLQNPSDEGYRKLVDRLLASPHFGERMATAWLDVVRYADTVGYHGDQNQNVFPYRDWVIDAINANMPFDQFTEYQLAGDLLGQPTTDSLIASCFNRLNMMTREGGAQPQEYLVKYSADRVRTVAGAWLGSTVGCAECHDHKFDPFTARDFYSLAAFFADLRQWGVYQDYGYTPNPDLKNWSNDHPFPPEIEVDVPYLHRRIETLRTQIDTISTDSWQAAVADEAASVSLEAWKQSTRDFLQRTGDGWQTIVWEQVRDEADQPLESTSSSAGEFSVTPGEKNTVRIAAAITEPLAAIRLELLSGTDSDALFGAPDRDGRLVVRFFKVAADGKRDAVAVRFADSFDRRRTRFANTFEILGVHDVWLVPAEAAPTATAVFQLSEPMRLNSDERFEMEIVGQWSPKLRVDFSTLIPIDLCDSDGWSQEIERWLADGPDSTGGFIARQWLLTASDSSSARQQVLTLEREIIECRRGRSPVQVSAATAPMTTRVLPRGNWQDESGPEVLPQVPEFLGAIPRQDGQRLSRRDLARWLTAPENPLTARVQMNRLWKHFFGQGLSGVLDDLGTQGQYPTHPELLDWLAIEFQRSGWDFKHMVRTIVLSDAYRRSSQPTAGAAEADLANRFLSRQNPRRLEAEIIRDNALAVAGLLNPDLGGPPVFPYQPDNYYQHLQFPNRRYVADRDDRQYRRGIYSHWQRTFLHPMLANFDAPSREECTGMRTEANTPLQALTLLNDPTFVEAAKHLSLASIESIPTGDALRIQWLYRRVLSRDPSAAETESLERFVQRQREQFRNDAPAAKWLLDVGLTPVREGELEEIAAWTAVGRVMLNLHESITRY